MLLIHLSIIIKICINLRNEILANIQELRNTFMQVGDDGKPRYDELVFPADGRGYFVIDTDPSVHTINKAKNETGVRLELRTMITDLLRQSMDGARLWAEKIPLVSAEDPNKRRFECDDYGEPLSESEPDKQTQNVGSLTAASAAGDTQKQNRHICQLMPYEANTFPLLRCCVRPRNSRSINNLTPRCWHLLYNST